MRRRLQLVLIVMLAIAPAIGAQVSNSTSVPIQYRGQIAVVEVTLNGQGPYLFALDTGSGARLNVDSSLVAKLKLPVNGKSRGGDPSGRNVREFDNVAVDSLKLGSIEFHNLTALSLDTRFTSNAPLVDGILGFSLFADYLLTLDYPGGRVTLTHGELPPANGSDIIAFQDPRRIPVVELSVGEQKVSAHLDSGNQVDAFILPSALIEKLKLASEPVVVGRARTVSNDVEIKQVRLSDTIKLGSFEFPKPLVAFPALSETNVGFKALREFSLTFDQKNKRLKLARSAVAPVTATAVTSSFVGQDYVGKFGPREISLDGSDLYLQREGGPKMKMAPIAKDEFTLERVPAARIRFVRDANGKVTEMQALNPAGEWESAKKAAP